MESGVSSAQSTIASPTELETLFPASVTVEIPGQESVIILPLTIAQTARISKALRIILEDGNEGMPVQMLLARYPDEMVSIIAAAINRSEAFYGALRADIGLRVAGAVFEVNVPFFVAVVAPMLAQLVTSMMTATGPTTSKSSSSTVTPTPGTTR